uniref:E3 ubiquitin-protein ligase HEL2-like n=1 Tax=Erigeron canadensis TaxID=72917 RepID=UPI001CB8F984|nr:E3 ubiquitin-protein ligase HEL2-like [Erigeron canadensis]
MDDTCAVCADTLEWVAYGICGHKEVCSTCVVRLRIICGDNCCCICKTESKTIFVTKALGDYTNVISDFSVFPSEDKEGQSGSYWYHEDTRSYFDNFEQYKMVKAMCKLTCNACDNVERENTDNIRQLKDHLFHQHKLYMCNLCLKGRKVFICEQKLYTKAQLERHKNTGDSQVDGTESERGGFKGHVFCKLCRLWFYEDNELYRHMETEHYHCSICKRRNIGNYEYYKNYDDLENHFREAHFYCEEAECLAKKFIVFPSEAEMKLHITQEHAGHMSRARRNATLQLSTNFTYGQTSEHGNRRGRRQNDLSEPELSSASEPSHETANDSDVNDMPPEESDFPPLPTGSYAISQNPELLWSNNQALPALPRVQTNNSLRRRKKSNHNNQPESSVSRSESAFPPLPTSTGHDTSVQTPESLQNNSRPPSTSARLKTNHNNQPSPSSVSRAESAFPPLSTGSDAITPNPESLLSNNQVQSTSVRLKTNHNNQPSPSSVSRPESAFPPLSSGSDAIAPNPESLPSNNQVWSTSVRLKTNHNNQPSPSSVSRPESAFPPLSSGSAAIAPNPENLPSNKLVWSTLGRLKTNHNNQPSPSSVSRAESAFPPLCSGPDAIAPTPESSPSNNQVWSTLARLKTNRNNQPSPSSVSRAESAFPPLSSGPDAIAPNPESLLCNNQAWSTLARLNNYNNQPSPSSVSGPSSTSRISHSTSALNLVDTNSVSDFPPMQRHNVPANGRSTESAKDLYSKNKPMVDKIRTDLELDDWTLPGGQFVLKLPKSDDESSSSYGGVKEVRSKQKEKKTSKFTKARLGNGSMVSLLDDLTNTFEWEHRPRS